MVRRPRQRQHRGRRRRGGGGGDGEEGVGVGVGAEVAVAVAVAVAAANADADAVTVAIAAAAAAGSGVGGVRAGGGAGVGRRRRRRRRRRASIRTTSQGVEVVVIYKEERLVAVAAVAEHLVSLSKVLNKKNKAASPTQEVSQPVKNWPCGLRDVDERQARLLRRAWWELQRRCTVLGRALCSRRMPCRHGHSKMHRTPTKNSMSHAQSSSG